MYENYSFEELRFMSPSVRRPSENLLVRSNDDGTYACAWTPQAAGCYALNVTVDGYALTDQVDTGLLVLLDGSYYR